MVCMLDPPKNLPRNYECDLIWEKGLCRCKWVKGLEPRSSWIRVGTTSSAKSPWKRRQGRRHTEEKAKWKQRQRLKWWVYKPRIAGSCQELWEKCGLESPSGPPGGTSSTNMLLLDFWSPELCKNEFVVWSHQYNLFITMYCLFSVFSYC